jgi:hypothetical protein
LPDDRQVIVDRLCRTLHPKNIIAAVRRDEALGEPLTGDAAAMWEVLGPRGAAALASWIPRNRLKTIPARRFKGGALPRERDPAPFGYFWWLRTERSGALRMAVLRWRMSHACGRRP